uniref:Uncharacterized protein n=1 Tax=Helianthus annuus TaxID=4232 RepID=A0A251RM26_HELAN
MEMQHGAHLVILCGAGCWRFEGRWRGVSRVNWSACLSGDVVNEKSEDGKSIRMLHLSGR